MSIEMSLTFHDEDKIGIERLTSDLQCEKERQCDITSIEHSYRKGLFTPSERVAALGKEYIDFNCTIHTKQCYQS